MQSALFPRTVASKENISRSPLLRSDSKLMMTLPSFISSSIISDFPLLLDMM